MFFNTLCSFQAEESGQPDRQLCEAELDTRPTRNHDEIDGVRKLALVVTEPFADSPLEEIALYRRPRLAADRDPETTRRGARKRDVLAAPDVVATLASHARHARHARQASHDDELRRRASAALPKHPRKVSRVEQPVTTLKPTGPELVFAASFAIAR